jgi:RNA polymerase sigma factor (sigma-70 family)
MVRVAVLLVDQIEVAEEVVQESFARAYRRWGRLEDPVAYVRACVVNASRDVLRKRRVRRNLDEAPHDDGVEPEGDHLRDALARLPQRQRAALVLRFYEDLSIEDIGRALGARPGTVKSLLHRGLAALREVVER